jgi:hypothetical protein
MKVGLYMSSGKAVIFSKEKKKKENMVFVLNTKNMVLNIVLLVYTCFFV